ncbi:hypothetical protein J1614_010723 [Plenodomus biglobosus]|nr:hypothetical protein J1614_010723 [Plenodomus biglobosus]
MLTRDSISELQTPHHAIAVTQKPYAMTCRSPISSDVRYSLKPLYISLMEHPIVLIMKDTPLQMFETTLFAIRDHNRHSVFARQWTALSLLFTYWHENLLILKADQSLHLSEFVAPYFLSLCEALEHMLFLFPSIDSNDRGRNALMAILINLRAAGHQRITAVVGSHDIKYCLEQIYNLLSAALLDTSRLAKPNVTRAFRQ